MHRAGVVTGPTLAAQQSTGHLSIRYRYPRGQEQNQLVGLDGMTLSVARTIVGAHVTLVAGGDSVEFNVLAGTAAFHAELVFVG